MRIFITGATGLIGRAAVLRLRRDGHTLAAWVRSPDKARALLGAEAELIDAGGGDSQLEAQLQRADAVLNLAGEPVVGKRWTARRRAALAASRGGLTGRLVEAMGRGARRPGVLVSASAVGIYGHRAAETLTEQSAPGSDFLARLCIDWEEAANRATGLGVRVVTLRTGIVLGRDGGALAPLLPVFKLGLGGPVGDGQGYVPWIHLVDVAEVIARAVSDSTVSGPLNVSAPTPATWREFAAALGNALGRPSLVPVPALALRLRFGAAAAAVLGSQRAVPARLQQLGFTFGFPELSGALRDVLSTDVEIVPVDPS
ncbi:MAG: TIGR01777 family oxidoreductase [Myxococcota bacterium]|nr:TIGR01777 family oxidoreductase [Myxococcota bacterium]